MSPHEERGATARLVSGALVEELRQKTRRHGVVVWLDADGAYSELVDAGIDDLRVLAYRGSFLELMLALEPLASGLRPPEVVVHLPRMSTDALAKTPLLELWKTGVSFERRLDTLVTQAASGRVHPDALAAFLAPKPTLAEADRWLARVVAESSAGVRAQLVALSPTGFVDELIGRGPLAAKVGDPVERQAMLEQAAVWFGLTDAWIEATVDDQASAEGLVFGIASFALAVEYVFDLRRAPYAARLLPLQKLSTPLRDACRALCDHLRSRHAKVYQQIADQTESELGDEVAHAVATDLGKIDTFRFEEDTVLKYALEALRIDVGAYEEAEALAVGRAEPAASSPSPWTRRPDRKAAWLIVRDMARLGVALERAPVPADLLSLDALVDAYVAHGAAADRAHRTLEQRRVTTLFPEVPYFEDLRRSADGLRVLWTEWADGWALAMARVCREQGFLPSARRLQRTLFDDVVMAHVRDAQATPKKTPGDVPTALFVVDALRFEMADELFREMAAVPHTSATLEARLAELPTLTCVGMNAIAPTASGSPPTLRPILSEGAQRIAIEGFATGAFKVDKRPARWRAMFDRAGGDNVELSLDDVVSHDSAQLKKRVARARLIVVHSLELDDAGESGVGPLAFDPILQKLRAAWRLLREADVRRFVITSDHGFLILDGIRRAPEVQGRKTDPDRRHQLTRNAAVDAGRVRVGLPQLGYSDVDGLYLVMSETTNVFDRGARSASFVHGGNSLQERVVPVISVVHRSATGASTGQYVVHAKKGDSVGGMHRVLGAVRLSEASQLSLAFAQAKELDLSLRVADGLVGTIELVHAGAGARVLAASTIRAEVDKDFEVFFRVSGAGQERVQLELAHVGPLDVEAAVVADFFEATVAASAVRAGASVAAREVSDTKPGPTSWLDSVQPTYRPIYERLFAHGVVDEAEAIHLLGNRAGRRFALAIDDDKDKLPFGVRVEIDATGKRWVRDGRVPE